MLYKADEACLCVDGADTETETETAHLLAHKAVLLVSRNDARQVPVYVPQFHVTPNRAAGGGGQRTSVFQV